MLLTDLDPWMSPAEAAEYTRISIPVLARMRASRTGPKFRKVGTAIQYRKSWLDEFTEQCTVTTKRS